MDKPTFLQQLHAERAVWDAILAEVGPARYEERVGGGEWTVKDIIAHIAWHEREMVTVIRAHDLAGSPWWDLPFDERNARIYAQHKEQPLDAVLAEAESSYRDFLAAFEMLVDADLNDPSGYPKMPADWEPWRVYSSNTYEHYHDHTADLRAWLGSAPQE